MTLKHYCVALLIVTSITSVLIRFTPYNQYQTQTESQPSIIVAESVTTLPFFIDTVTLKVSAVTQSHMHLEILNTSEYSFFFQGWQESQWITSLFGNIEIDYFDGVYWRNISGCINTYNTYDMWILATETHPTRIYVRPSDNSIIIHYPLYVYVFPKSGLFRVRKNIYMDSEDFPPGLTRILREAHEMDSNSWFELPGRPKHTLVAEFYMINGLFSGIIDNS